MFIDRIDAGRQLAHAIGDLAIDAMILGIPRGGVVVARAMAEELRRPLDVIVVRKLGAPRNPELAIGAIGPDGHVSLDDDVLRMLGAIPDDYVTAEAARALEEIRRRMTLYRGDTPFADVQGRSCVLVDDGIATGSTVRAALRWLRGKGAGPIVLAVPVAPARTVLELEEEADRVVCLLAPPTFVAVGQWYERFDQVSDDEVIDALRVGGGS